MHVRVWGSPGWQHSGRPGRFPFEAQAAATKNSSRSDLMNLPVGFNPRWEFRRVVRAWPCRLPAVSGPAALAKRSEDVSVAYEFRPLWPQGQPVADAVVSSEKGVEYLIQFGGSEEGVCDRV
jgi:hypothetical protein